MRLFRSQSVSQGGGHTDHCQLNQNLLKIFHLFNECEIEGRYVVQNEGLHGSVDFVPNQNLKAVDTNSYQLNQNL